MGHNKFDVAIIGGGITGASILLEASKRGYKSILFEKNTFGSGTTAKSTRLIHGGLRYLENFDFFMVYESLKQRKKMLELFPELVKPLEFIFPIFKQSKRGYYLVKAGLFLYDFLAGKHNIARHRPLTKKDLIEKYNLNLNDCERAFSYYDAKTDPVRLTEQIIKKAKQNKNIIAVENVRVVKAKKNNNEYELIYKESAFPEKKITANIIVNASGPWVDEVNNEVFNIKTKFLKLTKGTHLFLPKSHLKSALILSSHKDNRIFFIVPEDNYDLVGTTDIEYKGRVDEVQTDDYEIEYLLEEYNRYMNKDYQRKDIINTICGLRPLANSSEKIEGKVSRKHKIIHLDKYGLKNVYAFTGGKLTIALKMAEDLWGRRLTF